MRDKNLEWAFQGLLDYMGISIEETGEASTVAEMDAYLFDGYGITFTEEELDEIRASYVKE